jgi:GT2 family glycosyltransferase
VDLSIICVNWNSLNYLRTCIASIYEWTRGIAFEIIVVDNASPGDDADALKQEFPSIRVIKSSTNLGFAGANNLGVRQSFGKYLLFLNPDTELINPAINVMAQHLDVLPQAGIVGCKLLNADLSVQTSSIMKFPKILNSLVQVEYLRLRWPKLWGIGPLFSTAMQPIEVEAISGACMLVRREVFASVEMFSTAYFMYSEDVDLCYKLVQAGFKNYYVGQASIVHYGGRSSAPEWQTVMKTKAELQFFDRSYGRLYGLMYRISLTLHAVLRLLVLAGLRFVRPVFRKRRRFDSAWARWSATLRTVLTHWSIRETALAAERNSSR